MAIDLRTKYAETISEMEEDAIENFQQAYKKLNKKKELESECKKRIAKLKLMRANTSKQLVKIGEGISALSKEEKIDKQLEELIKPCLEFLEAGKEILSEEKQLETIRYEILEAEKVYAQANLEIDQIRSFT